MYSFPTFDVIVLADFTQRAQLTHKLNKLYNDKEELTIRYILRYSTVEQRKLSKIQRRFLR